MSPERALRARDVVVLIKRGLTTFRSYGVGHEARRTAVGDLFAAVQRFVDAHGSLAIQITAKAFFFDDEPLLVEDREEDATTRPLFIEGIQALVFTAALTPAELEGLLALWHIGATARFPDGRSLSTELWDADLKGIETRVVENFSEGADAEGDDGQRAHKHEELTVALLRGISAKELPGGGIVDRGPQRVVSGADLLPLTGDFAATMSDAVLERLAANRRTVVDALEAREAAELAAEVGAGNVAVRVHRALWTLLPDADVVDAAAIADLVGRVSRRLLEDDALELLRQALGQTMLAARLDPMRAGALGQFFAALASPDVVRRLVVAARTPARRADAVAILSFLDAGAMPLVIAALDQVVDDAEACAALVELLVRKGTSSTTLAGAVPQLTTPAAPQVVTALLEVAGRVRADGLAEVIVAGLAHRLVEVRRAVLARVTVELATGLAAPLASVLATEPDAAARREIVTVLMRAKQLAIVDPIVRLLGRATLDGAERQTYLRALATFGPAAGPAATATVRRLFETEKDNDVRASCALALGSIGDDSARAPLEAEARRLLANKAVKTACVEALRRMDARSGGGRA